jgi:hypothetical protein
MTDGRLRCSAWDSQQCKATTKLTAVVVKAKQGTFITVPDKVVVHLCTKHFQLSIPDEVKA